MIDPALIRTRMTAAEFLALPESNTPMELLDGEIIMAPSPIPQHQDIVGNVFVILKQLAKQIGGRAFVAPLDVYLDDHNVAQPDVLWIAENSRCQVTTTHLVGAPDLVVGVLSPSTAWQDKTVKFRLYQQHGVREYWLVDPMYRLVEVWRLVENRFEPQGVYGADEAFGSAVLGDQNVAVKSILES